MSEEIQCSVVIPTKESAKDLPILLESVVNDFTDVAICDGWSKDDTRSVAEHYGARVEMQDKQYLREDGTIKDFSGIRNQCTAIAKEKWVLNIDTGDYVDEKFKQELRKIIGSGSVNAYWIPRVHVIGGKRIDCASTYPSRQIRFYHKDAITTWIKPIHERVEMREGFTPAIFPANLYTPFPESVWELKRKWEGYIALEAGRRIDLSFRLWAKISLREAAIALKMFLRFLYARMTCRGNPMPFTHEALRWWYQFALIWALAKRVRKF